MSFEESTFIETVEQFPCIWDLKNKDHKNKIKLEAAWTSISHIFEDTVENCQENWKSIRGKYVRERKFVKEMPSGSGSYSGTWPNFEKLGFLASNVQIRRNMTGIEYVLLHVQEPILYVIRKQHRYSPQQVTPLADYYIIAGIVYQAPDLASVLNSRLLGAVHHLQSSFEEASGFSRYHPSKGYYWDFKSQKGAEKIKNPEKEKPKEETSSLFQRQRVDMLLGELIKKFPLPTPPQPKTTQAPVKTEGESGVQDSKEKIEIKQESKDVKPPPEKKPRLN